MPVSQLRKLKPFNFYLGVHVPVFMKRTKVHLFISRRVLSKTKNPKSYTQWALDSGGFTELSLYGQWITSPGQYAAEVNYWYRTVYGMKWAAIQDWMCEPFILEKTGLKVCDHQRLTIDNYHRLKELQPHIPWVPVLQGYQPREYIEHLRQYEDSGVDLKTLPLVGIGSVCRRQSTDVTEAKSIIRELYREGIKLHAFGFKVTGLKSCAYMLQSADSMSWSKVARSRKIRLPECSHKAKYCNNCLDFALKWREELIEHIPVRRV